MEGHLGSVGEEHAVVDCEPVGQSEDCPCLHLGVVPSAGVVERCAVEFVNAALVRGQHFHFVHRTRVEFREHRLAAPPLRPFPVAVLPPPGDHPRWVEGEHGSSALQNDVFAGALDVGPALACAGRVSAELPRRHLQGPSPEMVLQIGPLRVGELIDVVPKRVLAPGNGVPPTFEGGPVLFEVGLVGLELEGQIKGEHRLFLVGVMHAVHYVPHQFFIAVLLGGVQAVQFGTGVVVFVVGPPLPPLPHLGHQIQVPMRRILDQKAILPLPLLLPSHIPAQLEAHEQLNGFDGRILQRVVTPHKIPRQLRPLRPLPRRVHHRVAVVQQAVAEVLHRCADQFPQLQLLPDGLLHDVEGDFVEEEMPDDFVR